MNAHHFVHSGVELHQGVDKSLGDLKDVVIAEENPSKRTTSSRQFVKATTNDVKRCRLVFESICPG